jgi:spore coat protein SA
MIIFTGRLVPYKGVHILVEAMRILEKNGVRARCKIVGSAKFGSAKPTRYVGQLMRRLPENTELAGYLVGVALADQLRDADVFCCPSIWNDPFPLAPLEAMATGLPVVASGTGGLREMFANGGGLLVPPNDPQVLAKALETLVLDEKYRERLGAEARRSFSERFYWGSVRDQYERVICGLMF